MHFKLPLIAACVAMLSLSGCGGGGGSSAPAVQVSSPAQLTKIDTVVGTGVEAVAGKSLTVKYTGWLYSETAADKKGVQFETNPEYTFQLGVTNLIAGFTQGVTGMKEGGKRTILIPANLAFGAVGQGSIPPNSGLVFDIELRKVQ